MMLRAKIATILSHLSHALVPDRSDFHARYLLIVNSMCNFQNFHPRDVANSTIAL